MYTKTIKTYIDIVCRSTNFDSLATVNRIQEYIWDGNQPLNYTMENHIISQNLPNWYIITNGVNIASRQLMLDQQYFLGLSPYLFEIDKKSAIDIDDIYKKF